MACAPGQHTLAASLDLRLDILAEVYPMADTGRALFKVRSSLDGLTYALKQFSLERNDGGTIRREMAALNRQLNHPERFPRYRAYFEKDGFGFLLLDWMDGTQLCDAVPVAPVRGPAEAGARVEILRHICEALSWVHRARHLHRDLKPQNILLRDPRDPRKGVALIDFGLAVERRRGLEGTPGYAAPEQTDRPDFPLDQRTDLFAVGAIAWWLMTGQEFRYCGDGDEWSGVGTGTLCALAPGVSPALEAVILRALAYRPDRRPRSAQELKAQLGGARP